MSKDLQSVSTSILFDYSKSNIKVKRDFRAGDIRFIDIEIWLMHTMENLNGSYFSKEKIEQAIPTLANTPVLGYVENGDYSDHRSELEVKDNQYKWKYLGKALGVIPETNNARFQEREDEDGIIREYLVVDGIMWTKWDEPIEILMESGYKSQSMELSENYTGNFEDDNLFHFDYFEFFGACLLGDGVKPAMSGSTVEVKFETSNNIKDDIQNRLSQYYTYEKESNDNEFEVKDEEIGQSDSIEYSTSKEDADFDTPWGDVNKNNLRDKIYRASNYSTLIDKFYLIKEEGWEENQTAIKYPVGIFKDNILVLSANGLQSALSFLERNTDDPNYQSAKKKLKKYYEELDLDTSNFEEESDEKEGAKFMASLSHEQVKDAIWDVLNPVNEDGIREYTGWIVASYPEEKYVIVNHENDDNANYMKHYYEVSEEGVVTIDEGEIIYAEFLTSEEKTKLDELRTSALQMQAELEESKNAYIELETKYTELENTHNSEIEAHATIVAEYAEMKEEYESIKPEFEKIQAEKELEQKKEIIDSYKLLGEEDKKDVVENIENYSIEEIKTKLSYSLVAKQDEIIKIMSKQNGTDENVVIATASQSFSKKSNENKNLPEWADLFEEE